MVGAAARTAAGRFPRRKWSRLCPLATLGRVTGEVHSAIGSSESSGDKLGSMNPRYRRMVIPGALVGLILIAAVAALLKG